MQNTEKVSIPREQVIAGIELAKASLEEMRTSIRSLYECLQVGTAAINSEELNLKSSGCEGLVYSSIPCVEAEIHSYLLVNAARLYNASTHTIRYTPESVGEREQLGKECFGGHLAEAHLEPDGIFIRLPMLGSRNARPEKAKLDQNNASIFRSEIVYAIEHDSRFPSYDFSRYEDKIIQFLYVYNHDSTRNALRIIDNDNHDTKAIQDAVVLFLPGGDCGLSCSNYSESVLSKDVPEGTYITVTEAKNGVRPGSEIVRKWVEILQKNDP